MKHDLPSLSSSPPSLSSLLSLFALSPSLSQSICLSIATSVPILACTGAISYDDIMKCVQILAGSATVHNKVHIIRNTASYSIHAV